MRHEHNTDDPFLMGEGASAVLRVVCTGSSGSVPVALASGDIEAEAAREIGADLEAHATPKPRVMVLDLSAARMDAAALCEIEAASFGLFERGVHLLVVPPRDSRGLWELLAGAKVILTADLAEALVLAANGSLPRPSAPARAPRQIAP